MSKLSMQHLIKETAFDSMQFLYNPPTKPSVELNGVTASMCTKPLKNHHWWCFKKNENYVDVGFSTRVCTHTAGVNAYFPPIRKNVLFQTRL